MHARIQTKPQGLEQHLRLESLEVALGRRACRQAGYAQFPY